MSLQVAIDSQAIAARPPVVIGAWPRLLDAEKAAVYLGISKTFFLDCVANHTLPGAKRIGRRLLWDKHMLDTHVDTMFGTEAEGKVVDDEDW